MINLIFITIILLFNEQVHAAPINQIFPINTQIDKNQFFSNEVTRFEFEPSSLLLTYDKELKTFKDEHTDLIVETDIPKENDDIFLSIRMTELTTQCSDFNGSPINNSDGLASIYLEQNKMEIDEAIDLDFNDESNGYKSSKYDTRLTFEQLPANALDCSGSATMMLEFSI